MREIVSASRRYGFDEGLPGWIASVATARLEASGSYVRGNRELERRDLSTALITLCIGAGMGTAMIIEAVMK